MNEGKKKQIPLRISAELFDELSRWAESDFRSVNGQIEYLLTECVIFRISTINNVNRLPIFRKAVLSCQISATKVHNQKFPHSAESFPLSGRVAHSAKRGFFRSENFKQCGKSVPTRRNVSKF